jgi:Domain of unknown function (DUF4349)
MRRTISKLPAVLPLVSLLAFLGCGVQTTHEAADSSGEVPSAVALAGQKQMAGEPAFAEGAAGREAAVSTPAGLNRKIIYTAEIELAVEDFSRVPERLIALVKKLDAYVADSSLAGSTGENRRGTWKIRVPVARFEEFVSAAKGLGELIHADTSSRDVSEEYYDVDARIRNKTKEEERLLKLLEERPGKLEDVIAIERELSRVREELERMQARLRVLVDLTSLTTVELTIVEIRDYQPPEAPTLATRVRRTFEGSLSALRSAGESLLIGVVALTPWFPVAAVGLCPVYLLVRRARKSRRRDE